MRQKTILQGKRVGTWMLIAEETDATGKRKMVCRCLGCGTVKTFRADRITSGDIKDCKCGRDVPYLLEKNAGYACRSRVMSAANCDTKLNRRGYCCYHCSKYQECEYRCLNTPDKCGSFYTGGMKNATNDGGGQA